MRLTRAAEYAFRATRFLAVQEADAWTSMQAIAYHEDVPPPFLAKVLGQLQQGGVVTAMCGRTGGYRLARAANLIRLSDVFTAIEGPLTLNTCLVDGEYKVPCGFETRCPMHDVLQKVQDSIVTLLDGYTVADIKLRPLPQVLNRHVSS